MGDKAELNSPLHRARFGFIPWLEALPKDARLDAEMALDRFHAVAVREIEQAYFDGANNRQQSQLAAKWRT